MIVKFAIEPEALDDAQDDHFRMCRRNFWNPYGALVDPIRGNASLLSRNSKYKNELQLAYKNFRDQGWPLWIETAAPIPWDDIDACSDLAKYREQLDLALIEEVRADVFGVPQSDDKFSKICGEVDVARIRHSNLSDRFKAAKDLSQAVIPIGMPLKDLWRERFQTLAMCSNGNQQVTIVDRYISSNIWQGHSELFRLLEFLREDSPGCVVTIFSSGRDAPNLNEVKERLDNNIAVLRLSKDGIKRITFFMCHDDVFRKHAHERWMRFAGITCSIEHGIDIFRSDNVSSDSAFSLKSPEHIKTYRDREGELRKRQKPNSPWQWKA